MNEQERNELIEAVKAQMNGNVAHDTALLEDEISKLEGQPDSAETANALLELAYGMFSPEERDYLRKKLYIGEKRLDQIYHEASDLMRQGRRADALQMTRALYEHILIEFRETDEIRFFSFRNPLESNLYHLLYHPTKKLMKAPCDFSLFIGAHAYNLIEAGRAQEAIPVLREAIRYNPVSPDPRFELAEVYKLTGDNDALLEAVLETLPLCTSAYAISRCYANLGYWCVNIKDYESAIRFYYESLNFADHPAIPTELKHVEALSGKPLIPPTKEMINAAFAKYQIYHGPGQEVLHVARELAKQAEDAGNWQEAAFYLNVVISLIRDDDAQQRLNQIVEKAKESQ